MRMTCYSHSRLATFEQCPYKYKLQYLERIKPTIPTTIEAFMGDLCHRSLEALHDGARHGRILDEQQLIDGYCEAWERRWHDAILIVKHELTAEHYKALGERYLRGYHRRYAPFDGLRILGLETQERLDLADGNQYHIRIDKLARHDQTYYVCDYKTSSRLPTQADADADRQLAMYALWVRRRYADAERVVQLWYYLAHDTQVRAEHTALELEQAELDVTRRIAVVEAASEFPTHTSKLCEYCGYRPICPRFTHRTTAKPFEEDDEAKPVDATRQKERKEEVQTDLLRHDGAPTSSTARMRR